MGSVEKPEPKEDVRKGASPASSESSFISGDLERDFCIYDGIDSDIDDDEKMNERANSKVFKFFIRCC